MIMLPKIRGPPCSRARKGLYGHITWSGTLPGQPQGGRDEGRLVRPGAQPQDPLLRRALRHRVPADPPLHAPPQGEGRAGRGLCPGERLEGQDLRQPGGAEPLPPRLGADGGRHSRARHDTSSRRQPVCQCRAGRAPAPAARPVPVIPRGPPHGAPRRPYRGRARLLLGAPGVPRPPGLGPLGCPAGTDLQRPDGATEGVLPFLSANRGRKEPLDRENPAVPHLKTEEPLKVHPKQEPGRFSTHPAHIASEKVSGVERGAAWQLARVRRLGPHSARWAEAVVAARGVESVRVLMGLLSLAQRHPVVAIERACGIAADYGAYHLRTVRALIDRDAPEQETMPFMSEHPMIRPLSEYDLFVHDAFPKEILT